MSRLVVALLLSLGLSVSANAQDIANGEAVFDQWCDACHGAPPGPPGTNALQAKYQGAIPALLEERTDMTPEFVELFVRNGITIMPFFRKTEVSDEQLDDLSAYLTRNNGN